jgi:hypothetical protein
LRLPVASRKLCDFTHFGLKKADDARREGIEALRMRRGKMVREKSRALQLATNSLAAR